MSVSLQDVLTTAHAGWVLYRFPGEEKKFIAGELEDSVKEGFCFSDFAAKEISCIKPSVILELSGNNFPGPGLPLFFPRKYSFSQTNFKAIAGTAIEEIKTGKLTKVVLSRQKKVTIESPFEPVDFFNELCSKYQGAFIYLMSTRAHGTWAGVSPEILAISEGRNLRTIALAGTRSEDEKFSEKEYREQQLVTDYIQDVLKTVSSKITVGDPAETKAGDIIHLKTEISAELNPGIDGIKAAKLLHPTPAVCGIPARSAADFIMQKEGYDRGLYSGFIGEVGKENVKLYVNLRCMQLITESEALLYAGAGIVEGSDPGKEYRETENKMETMLQVLKNGG